MPIVEYKFTFSRIFLALEIRYKSTVCVCTRRMILNEPVHTVNIGSSAGYFVIELLLTLIYRYSVVIKFH